MANQSSNSEQEHAQTVFWRTFFFQNVILKSHHFRIILYISQSCCSTKISVQLTKIWSILCDYDYDPFEVICTFRNIWSRASSTLNWQLSRIISYYITLYCIDLYRAVSHLLHCVVLRHIASYRIDLYNFISNCFAAYALHCLYYVTSYIVLCNIALCHIAW